LSRGGGLDFLQNFLNFPEQGIALSDDVLRLLLRDEVGILGGQARDGVGEVVFIHTMKRLGVFAYKDAVFWEGVAGKVL